MKVILIQDVNKVGRKGELVEVSDGYARNYLFRNALAEEGTPSKVKEWEEQQRVKKNREAKLEKQAIEIKKKIGGKKVNIKMTSGDDGRLFGSVTSQQVAAALKEQLAVDVDKKDIKFDEPVKQLGKHPFKVKLYTGIDVELSLSVEAE